MEKSVLRQLTGKEFPTSPADLKDFTRLISHLGYPYIVRSRGAKVEGILIRNIDPQSMKKLDQYEDEGRLYSRQKVTVVSDRKKVGCQAYLGNLKVLRPKN
jgi:gamma-glutamylcyclotransferase (GGCT)/AIG2-like uncharacterized protein YtfP